MQFQAHLVPLDQGELASCYVTPTRASAGAELRSCYADAYAEEPFVEVVERPPGVRDVRETNYCRLFAAADEHTGKVLALLRDRQPLEGHLLAGAAEPQPDVRPPRDEGAA